MSSVGMAPGGYQFVAHEGLSAMNLYCLQQAVRVRLPNNNRQPLAYETG